MNGGMSHGGLTRVALEMDVARSSNFALRKEGVQMSRCLRKGSRYDKSALSCSETVSERWPVGSGLDFLAKGFRARAPFQSLLPLPFGDCAAFSRTCPFQSPGQSIFRWLIAFTIGIGSSSW